MRAFHCLLLLLVVVVVAPRLADAADPVQVGSAPSADAFPLVADHRLAALWVDEREPKVVQFAARAFADDVGRVTGAMPVVSVGEPPAAGACVMIGTLGQSKRIDGLVADGKLDVAAIRGGWEAFTIAVVADPSPGVPRALVIAGSDRRGTAYGVFTVSEAIGVSPWYWWADVPPVRRDALFVTVPTAFHDAPAVKYRGIFINDEDWGLQPWAARTFEPETGDIGPKTYAKVFELLLRLRANFVWPAMHPSTKAFNLYPDNKRVADEYAIVMGSSHAEPMLRNNVTEWNPATDGQWDYDTNRDGIDRYWEVRVRENGRYENVYTLGMRGIHDSAMPGGGTVADKVARLRRVIDDQRGILARQVNARVERVPQVFVPYKEVLPLYENGLKLPDDVTLVWPDDNHGYIRRLSSPEEQKRPGGAGVYYHLSYWGKPEDYLWLCSTPPALVWEEMSKAYDHGARTLWVVNVGDIKPAEVGMDFFFQLAWRPGAWDRTSQPKFLREWALRTFGKDQAVDVAAVMDEYYRLNYATKPEHLLLNEFSPAEADERLDRFARLVGRANALYTAVPTTHRDAFYELVVYPVRCSALMNRKQLYAKRAGSLAAAGERAGAAGLLKRATEAHDEIQVETRYYKEVLAGGKWNGILSAAPRNRPVFRRPDVAATTTATSRSASSTGPVAVAGGPLWIEAERPTRTTDDGAAGWRVIEGLGRSGDSVTVLPTTYRVAGATSQPGGAGPALEYEFEFASAGAVSVSAHCIPTHAIDGRSGLRYAIAVDDEAPQFVNVDAPEFSPEWSANVVRAAAIGRTRHVLARPGRHTLRVWSVDPGVVIDRFAINP
jgi:hypothetical protein